MTYIIFCSIVKSMIKKIPENFTHTIFLNANHNSHFLSQVHI